jgi:hypothetical protein
LGILHRFSWLSVIIILLSCFLLKTIIFHRFILFRSKYTAILLFEFLLFTTLLFVSLSSACVYRFFGILGLTIQSFSLLIACILICSYYYDYWYKIWKKHEKYNETEALDLEHGRFDIVSNFDWSEGKVKKVKGQNPQNPAIPAIVSIITPIGVSIPIIFGKFDDRTSPLIICWVFSLPAIFYLFKVDIGAFITVSKLFYYEKKIGKPIINGLLEE